MDDRPKSYDRPLTLAGFLWALPVTLLGLLALLATLPRLHRRDGVLLGTGDRGFSHLFLTRRGFAAITMGRVVIAVKPLTLETWNHELEHARQAECWGPLYVPAYLFWQARVGYKANPFERRAVEVADAFRRDHPELARQILEEPM